MGGTANTTNRGTTLKNFIQNGKSCGDVAIRLRNYGEDAYKPDLYGRSITVERRFFSNGTSSYKLKSENHKVIANKKEELAHILDQFNIQVDNPLCILNQDASRKFLQSENPKRLYKLFLRATQLQQMREDYANAVSQKITANSILDKKLQVNMVVKCYKIAVS